VSELGAVPDIGQPKQGSSGSALARLREDQAGARTAATNQLWAMLGNYWPGPRDLFYSLASPIALAFLPAYPTPQSAARLGKPGWRVPAAPFLPRRQAPGRAAGPAARRAPGPRGPARHHPHRDGPRTSSSYAACRPPSSASSTSSPRVAAYPRARLLAHLPGVGTINLARLLAEVGPILDRATSAEQAASECGTAPVTRPAVRPSFRR
jgi:hypothetical protein